MATQESLHPSPGPTAATHLHSVPALLACLMSTALIGISIRFAAGIDRGMLEPRACTRPIHGCALYRTQSNASDQWAQRSSDPATSASGPQHFLPAPPAAATWVPRQQQQV
jgi:hypothetical protein